MTIEETRLTNPSMSSSDEPMFSPLVSRALSAGVGVTDGPRSATANRLGTVRLPRVWALQASGARSSTGSNRRMLRTIFPCKTLSNRLQAAERATRIAQLDALVARLSR